MQCAIDNAKRTFDVDLVNEIDYIKEGMNVKDNGYPLFWALIRPEFNKKRINYRLSCPMNYLSTVSIRKIRSKDTTIPIKHFFVKHKLKMSRRQCKKVEELIEQYSLELYNYNKLDLENDDYLLLRSDLQDLIDDIKRINISSNYSDLMSWLIDRAFCITTAVKRSVTNTDTNLNKNRSLLIKTLYECNPKVFLSCFTNAK